jgi:hypothetical protein
VPATRLPWVFLAVAALSLALVAPSRRVQVGLELLRNIARGMIEHD